MKLVYLGLLVSSLALAGEHRVVSCKSGYTGTFADIETTDNGANVASSKLAVTLKGLFNLPQVGLVQEAVLEVPRTACDFEAQDDSLIRCSHVFGPGATLKLKTEAGDKVFQLQHAELETRKITAVRARKFDVRLRVISRTLQNGKIQTEFFQSDCSAKN